MHPILESAAGRYRWDEAWAELPPAPENGRTHGLAFSRDGRLFVFRQAAPSILAYDPAGRLVGSWGDFPGAHGLTLVEENGAEFLWLADETGAVAQTDLEGKVVRTLPLPGAGCRPTWVAANARNGDIWLADGYGEHLVHRYDAAGRLLATLDGTAGAGRFKTPHGLWFDSRKEAAELYVADRSHGRVQVFDGEGRFLRAFGAPFLNRPCGFARDGDRLLVPDLRARLTILDLHDRPLAHLGENDRVCALPEWPDGTPLSPGLCNSPHAAAADAAGNLYLAEWRRGGRIARLERLDR